MAFEKAVEIIRAVDCSMKKITLPFRSPGSDLSNIEADRKSVAAKIESATLTK